MFSPKVGSELQCTVSSKELGLVTCLVHGVFKVQLVNPAKCWEAVFIGQTVRVKVDGVEQLALGEPRIVGSLLEEVGDDIITPCIDIVDNFEDDEVECVTDNVGNNVGSKEQSSNIIDGGDGSPHLTSRKRKLSKSYAAPGGTKNTNKKNQGPSPHSTPTVKVQPSPGKKSVSKAQPKSPLLVFIGLLIQRAANCGI